MTKEIFFICSDCGVSFNVEVPNIWTKQDIKNCTNGISPPGQSKPCDWHPKDLGTLDLSDGILPCRVAKETPPEKPKHVSLSPHNSKDGRHRNHIGNLTPRQLELLKTYSPGTKQLDIAQKFGITLSTVKKHLTEIRDALGVTSTPGAYEIAREKGLLE